MVQRFEGYYALGTPIRAPRAEAPYSRWSVESRGKKTRRADSPAGPRLGWAPAAEFGEHVLRAVKLTSVGEIYICYRSLSRSRPCHLTPYWSLPRWRLDPVSLVVLSDDRGWRRRVSTGEWVVGVGAW